MVKLHCMAAVKRDAAGRVQKKLWLAKLKEHPRVNKYASTARINICIAGSRALGAAQC